jgi:3alpha(or 20beta)-hydroxysteroid dehydrogenase
VNRLLGKVAIVTGAARGIGRGIADAMAGEGATVIGCDVASFESEKYVACEVLDVVDESRWHELVAGVTQRFGSPTVLVNNAGIAGQSDVVDCTLEEWNRVISVDQTGVFLGMKAVIPAMKTAGGGSIINISSICGAVAIPGAVAYHAAKAGVILLTKNAAVTYARDGIRANVILPGSIITPMTQGQPEELNSLFIDATPLGRQAVPSEVGWAAVFLASEEASFITGVELPVDGGYLAA